MHITGSARDLVARMSYLRDRSAAMRRQDTLIFGASLVAEELGRGLHTRASEIESAILSQLRLRRPGALVLVVEDHSRQGDHELLTVTRGIIRGVTSHFHRQIRRTLPAVGIVARPEERALVARRVAYFTQWAVDVGSGVAVLGSLLSRRGLRRALLETGPAAMEQRSLND